MKNHLIKNLKRILFFAFLISCGKSGPKKGSELNGSEAVEFLAGENKKTWQLVKGHDYYEYLQFDNKNEVFFQAGIAIKYEVKGDKLTLKDFQDFTYTIIEIGDDKLIMNFGGHDTLTYVKCNKKIVKDKTVGDVINSHWLKGKYGTSWKFVDGEKTYSFMNDGRILDASSLVKVDSWKIHDSIMEFGEVQLRILRLSPVFFDYDVYGMTVKLNYVSEALKDGSPIRK